MKRLILLLLICVSCQREQKENDWMKGGTLHKGTIQDWENSSDANKLATCADFVVSFKNVNKQKYLSGEDIKYDAVELKNCIQTVIEGGNANSMTIAEIAVSCNIVKESMQ